jgi:hypothetical protein
MAVPQDLVDKLRDLGISERSARFALTVRGRVREWTRMRMRIRMRG